MKQMFKSLCAVAVLSALVAGCSKEGGEGQDDVDGKKGFVQLVVDTEIPQSRAGALDGEPATSTAETTLDPTQGLRVIIFSESGQQEFAQDMALEAGAEAGSYQTSADRIELVVGRHYFFVFANALKSKIALPTAGQTKDQWMAAQFGVTYTKDANQDATGLEIAQDDEFLLGSLWQETIIAPAGGKNTQSEAAVVPLQVGRLASKIVLTEVKKGTSNMNGTFTLPKFRMGTLALKMTNAGVASEAPLGTKTNTLVTSAKHNAPFTKGGNVTAAPYLFNDDDFQQYSVFKEVKADASNFFYAAENTTARQSFAIGGITGIGAQFYGNTTYVQIETVYTPVGGDVADGEVYVLGGTSEAPTLTKTTLSGATFYTAGVGANRIILASKPASLNAAEAALLGVASVDDIVTYTDGKNYHKFPVQDPGEGDYIYKNRVLRNHYYTYTVESIEELGSHTPAVDPTEPIEDKTFLKLSITVRNWDKVSGGIPL